MINIKTKSISLKKSKFDGIRICVMRRIRPEYQFDIWIPELAPSEKLLQDYVIKKRINWKDFEKKYRKQVLLRNNKFIKLLKLICENYKVTLLCFEKNVKYCHRSLILKELNRLK